MECCDVLVVGAGIAGASAAYELAASCRVIVLERESQPGYHTTGRSAAQFLETYGNKTVRILTKASRRFFDGPPEGFAEHPLLTPRGAIYIAREEQSAKLEETLVNIRELTPAVQRMSSDETLKLVPALRSDYVAGAIFEPDSMDIDVHAVHQGFLKGVSRRNGKILVNSEITGLARRGGTWEVETRDGSFSAPVVVNAAGAWCDEIARLAGVRPCGLEPKRRTVFTFEAPAGLDIADWPATIDIDEQFYFKPEAGRILASPADETLSPPCDAQPEEIDIALAVDRVQTATTLAVPRINSKWAGLRSFVADKTPVVGMDDEAEGFFWLAGQGGYGIQTAPAIARTAAALIASGALPGELTELGLRESDLSPQRLR